MSLISDYCFIKWNKKNKSHFIDKGYKFTKYGDEFRVKVCDLQRFSTRPVRVKCDYCGKEFIQSYDHYIDSLKSINKSSCKECVGKKCAEITLNKRRASLYSKINIACKEHGYLLISSSEDIYNNKSHIKYKCPIHGEQTMRIANMINGKGCPLCAIDLSSERFKLSDDVVNKRIEQCGGVWVNKGEYRNRHEKNLVIKCPICGTKIITSYVLFTQHGGQLCDACQSKSSLGEQKIRLFLKNNDLSFKEQFWFDDCRDIYPLPFDFYSEDLNTAIEFDGRQHFSETNYFSYTYDKTKKHDFIKDEYCSKNNIRLIRIPYWNINKIDDILTKELLT